VTSPHLVWLLHVSCGCCVGLSCLVDAVVGVVGVVVVLDCLVVARVARVVVVWGFVDVDDVCWMLCGWVVR